MENLLFLFGTIKMRIVLILSACVFILLSCQPNQDKISQLESEIATLKAENNSLKYNTNTLSAPNTSNYGQANSQLAGYYMYSDARLMQSFKDYMSDQYFSYESFKKSGKTLRIRIPIVSNISIRSIQKNNPDIFKELLNRVDKIVFLDQFGASMTIKKMDEF